MTDAFLSLTAPVADFFQSLGNVFLELPNRFLALSIQLSLVFALIWLLRKPLSKVASMKYVIRLMGSGVVVQSFLNPRGYKLLSPAFWYSHWLDFSPPLQLGFPARIASQIAELPSARRIDWLAVAFWVWLAGAVIFLCCTSANRRAQQESLLHPDKRTRCPAHMEVILREVLMQDPRWRKRRANVELCCIEELTSPCTFDTRTSNPVIALDRLDYTDDELRSILRHEVAHITMRHWDAVVAFDLLHAMCWFNPLMLPIKRWSRQQIELVADEDAFSRRNAPQSERVSYARLLVSLAEERGLQGAVLHLSAGATYLRQRVEAILRPRGRRLSMPVTVLLIVLALHTSLVVAPGETYGSRFGSKLALLNCLGNTYDSVTRGLNEYAAEAFCDASGQRFHLNLVENRVAALVTALPCETSEQQLAAAQYRDEWIAELSGYLGEPEVSDGGNAFSWPVTLPQRVRARLWYPVPEAVSLSLSWKDVSDDRILLSIELTQAKTKPSR